MAGQKGTAADDRVSAISLDQAARLLMVTPQWVRKLVREGWITALGRGSYPLVGVVQGYIKFLKDEERKSTKTAAASRKDEARTREIEQRIAERDRRLIDLEEHDAVLDEVVGTIKASFVGLPARVTRDLDLRAKIEAEVDDVFRSAAARLAQRGAELREGRSVAASIAEDDPG